MKLVLISKSFAFTQNRSKRKEEGREVLNARIVRDERWLKKTDKKRHNVQQILNIVVLIMWFVVDDQIRRK